MTAKYAKDQPDGFTNRIERITIVGVSYHTSQSEHVICASLLTNP